MSSMTPQQIVAELDRHIVGQQQAKRAVAIALRNRWRRQQVAAELRPEITPKNILMIGPTGVGKTEIARRLARLATIAFEVNERTENIGARRLSTVMERLLDEVSFDAAKLGGQAIRIDSTYVDGRLAALSHDEDLSRFIL